MHSATEIRLYVLVASHPCVAVELMLRRKHLEYRRIELPALLSRSMLRAMRFPGRTVPAARLGDRRVQGSRSISRVLDELRPDPPLFPPEPRARRAVENAEEWGEDFQDAVRRIELWGLSRDRSGVEAQLRASTLRVPPRLGARLSGPVTRRYARIKGATDAAVRHDLDELPAMLDQIDAWLDEGVIGTDEPNAADCQLAASVRLLMTMEDLRGLIEGRPAGALARRLVPDYPSHLSAGVLPISS